MATFSEMSPDSADAGALRNRTLVFFLGFVIAELNNEIDFRTRGHGRNALVRACLYLGSLARDIFRIPTHYERGISQAQFRFREAYIDQRAIPTLLFFRDNYPLTDDQKTLLQEALDFLHQAQNLSRDGRLPRLDAWYATIEEFYHITTYCQSAAARLEELSASLES